MEPRYSECGWPRHHPHDQAAQAQIFDEAQARAFLESIFGHRLEALFWLALRIGPRERRITRFAVDGFDFASGRVYLVRSLQRVNRPEKKKSRLELLDTKTRDSGRGIWLPQIVLEKVLAHRTRQDEERKFAGSAWREMGMVFTTRIGSMLDPRNLLDEYFKLRDRTQLPKIRFHDLRHSAATILKMVGTPDQAIQKLLGHDSVRTTQEFYTHLTLDAEKRAGEKMDEIFRPVAVKNAKVRPG